jgi:bifunctional DNA-binding transcriptional regulator/antitoxin component of YhaV-PrlF toxin-antitoxin module
VVDLDSWPEREERLSGDIVDMKALGSETAVFKARVQRGGRISIPDAERESLDIRHGQIVQALVFPLEHLDEDAEDAPEEEGEERTHDAEDESDE